MYMQMGGWCLTTSGAKVPVYTVVERCVIVKMECWTPVLHSNVCDNGNGPENLAMLVNVVVGPLVQNVKVLGLTIYSLPMVSCL